MTVQEHYSPHGIILIPGGGGGSRDYCEKQIKITSIIPYLAHKVDIVKEMSLENCYRLTYWVEN